MDSVKEGTPSDEELEEVAVEIGDSWERLGRRLKFSEAQITAFYKEKEKYSEKAYKMLLAWKKRNGPDALYRVLYEALCHHLVGHRDLATTFCCDKADEVVSIGRGKRSLSNTATEASKRPKLITGNHKATSTLVFRFLQQLGLETRQIQGKEVDLFNDLKQNARNEGFMISNNRGGGNCMFYSLAEQLQLVKGISFSHGELRRKLVAFLWKNPKLANGTDLFNFIAGYSSWTDYLKGMAEDGTWGDHVVLAAAANCFQVPIHVISSLRNHQNLFIHPESAVNHTTPLVLGHVHELHYVSLQPLQGFQSGEHRPSSAGTASHPQNEFQSGEHQPTSSGISSHSQNARAGQSSECVESLTRTVCLPFYELISYIGDVYIRRARLQTVPWCDTSLLSLQGVYTRLTMKARKMQSHALTSRAVKMYDIFSSHDDCKNPRSVLVEGDPGIGKTTFCLKMANDWATGAIPVNVSFPEVKLVLLLKCRDVDESVQKAIVDQLFPEVADQEQKSCLEQIQQIEDKLLLILDGLDELPEQARQDVNKVLLRKVFPRCLLVATARQERGIHVRKEFDTLLEIEGFTRRATFDYIKRHFQDKGKKFLADALIKEIKDPASKYLEEIEDHESETSDEFEDHENEHLEGIDEQDSKNSDESRHHKSEDLEGIKDYVSEDLEESKHHNSKDSDQFEDHENEHFDEIDFLLSELLPEFVDYGSGAFSSFSYVEEYLSELLMNPLNTVLLCLVFEECEGKLPSTRTELYQSIVFCLLKRFCTKNGIPFNDSTLFEQFEDVLVGLGKLAFDGLKDGCLYFSEKNLNSSTQQVPQMGFVSKEASTKVIKPEHSYSFPHKTFQEFFAALYLAHLVRTDTADVYEFISRIEEIEDRFRQVLLFVAGVLGKDGGRHFKLLGQLIKEKRDGFKHPWKFLCDSFKESGDIKGMAAATARSMSISDLVIEGGAILEVVDYSCVQHECKCEGHENFQYAREVLVTFGDVVLPSGLDKFLSENRSLHSLRLCLYRCCAADAVLTSVFKALLESLSLTSLTLDISRWKLGGIPQAFLGKGLLENTSLTSLTLDMFECDLNDATQAFLGKVLLENTSLTSLNLNMSSYHDATISAVMKSLSENTSLTSLTLDMSCSNLNDAGLASLGNVMSENTSLTSLNLNMSSCLLYDAGLALLGNGLSENTSLTSLTLDMSWCYLSDAGLASLGNGLSENTSLTSLTLDMSGCHINYAGLVSLGNGLSENTSLTSLTLDMSELRILNDAGVASLSNTSLIALTLNMSMCKLEDDVIVCLVNGLSENTSLTSLTLHMSKCHLNDVTLAFLIKGLSENLWLTSLTLDLSDCDLHDVTLAFLSKALLENTSLTSLNLKMSDSLLNDAALAFLIKGLSGNTSLTSLTVDMSGCDLSDVTLDVFSKGLSENTSLTSLTLNMCKCCLKDATLTFLSKGLSENMSLTLLILNNSMLDPNDATSSSITECLSRGRR